MSIKDITVVFIGQLSMSRSKMQEEATEYGLTVKNTINAQTDFLVTNLQISESIHVEKAQQLEITILSEEEYRKLLPHIADGIKLLQLIFSKDFSTAQEGLQLLKTKKAQLPKKTTPISRYAHHFSLTRNVLISNIQSLRLIGDPEEKKLKFSDLLLEAEQDDSNYYWSWRSFFADSRAHHWFPKNIFPNLKTLSIQDDTVVGKIEIMSPSIEAIFL